MTFSGDEEDEEQNLSNDFQRSENGKKEQWSKFNKFVNKPGFRFFKRSWKPSSIGRGMLSYNVPRKQFHSSIQSSYVNGKKVNDMDTSAAHY